MERPLLKSLARSGRGLALPIPSKADKLSVIFAKALARHRAGRIPEGLWMSEFSGIDSIFGVRSMPKPCSLDLRERVLDAVETGASQTDLTGGGGAAAH